VDAGQGTHAGMPEASATLPLAHAVQVLLLEAATLRENLPGTQASQEEELAAAEKEPAAQTEQT
jgi:hypothetical protein